MLNEKNENYFDDAKDNVLAELDSDSSLSSDDTAIYENSVDDNGRGDSQPYSEPSGNDSASQTDPYDILSQQSNALGDATSRIQAYKAEINSLKQQLAEQNNARRDEVIQNALHEELKPPTPPDFSQSDYMTDEERNKAWSDFIGQSTDYAIAAARMEYQPFIDAAKKGQKIAEEQAIIENMSRPDSGLPGFADELPTIRRVISENPLFKNSDDTEANFLNAYLLTKGSKSFEPKSSLSDSDLKLITEQQLMNLYDSNPDFQRAIAKRLQENLKNGNNVPQFAASGDSSNSAVANKEEPVLTFEEAAKRMERYL